MTRVILIFPLTTSLEVVKNAIQLSTSYEQIIIKFIPTQTTNLNKIEKLNKHTLADCLQNYNTIHEFLNGISFKNSWLFNLELDCTNYDLLLDSPLINLSNNPLPLFVDYFFQDGDQFHVGMLQELKAKVQRLDFNYLLTDENKTADNTTPQNLQTLFPKNIVDNYDIYYLESLMSKQISTVFHEPILSREIDEMTLLEALKLLSVPAIYYYNGENYSMYVFGKNRYYCYSSVPHILDSGKFGQQLIQYIFKKIQRHSVCSTCPAKNRCILQGWWVSEHLKICEIVNLFGIENGSVNLLQNYPDL